MYSNEFICTQASYQEVMKLSQSDLAILRHMEVNDSYGTKIIGALLFSTEGEKLFSNGTIYPALKRLKKQGYLISYQDDSNLPEERRGKKRTMYSITPRGISALQLLDNLHQNMRDFE